jgi:hypothetical protein
VGDVAEAIARAIERTERRAITFECGGPRIYSYGELLRVVAREAGLEARLMPMPFAAWHVPAWMGEMLPNPPVTRNQIELMQVDNVASGNVPGFAELGISPRPIENVLQERLVPRANGRWLRLHPSGGENPLRDLGMDRRSQIALYRFGDR